MTLLIPLLLRLTALFERGVVVDEPAAAVQSSSEEKPQGEPERG